MPVLVMAVAYCLLFSWPETVLAQSRGHLGVFIQNAVQAPEGSDKASVEGVLIIGLMRQSPAEQAGLKRGDVIVRFNGVPVRQVEDLQRLLAAAPPGEVAEIEVLRRDEILSISAKIEPAPASLPPRLAPTPLPNTLQQDELLGVMVAAAGLSLLLVYLASAQPWRRWELRHIASLITQARGMRVSNHQVVFAAAGLLVAIFCVSSLTIVEPGYQGVVFHLVKGVQDETLTEGLHFLLTGLNRVTMYDTRARVYHVRDLTAPPPPSPPPRATSSGEDRLLWTPTADGLKVGLDLTLRYRPDPRRLADLHRHVGPEFETKLVHPIVWNVTRLVASEYSLLDIYGKRRHELQQQAFRRVQALLARDGLIGEDLLLRDVVYTPEFEKTLVAKMVAEQKVQESAFEVEQAGLRAQVNVIEAQGEAQALELINRSLQNHPLLLDYLWIKSLPERVKVMVVPQRSVPGEPRIKAPFPEALRLPAGGDGGG